MEAALRGQLGIILQQKKLRTESVHKIFCFSTRKLELSEGCVEIF